MARSKAVDESEVEVLNSEVGVVAPRGESPQQYDGGEVPGAVASVGFNSEVDNTSDKPAPEIRATTFVPGQPVSVTMEPVKHEILKNAKIKLTEASYLGDVYYDAGSVIESYSGPKGPHMVVVK